MNPPTASANCTPSQAVLALRSCDIVFNYVSSLIATCGLIWRAFGALATAAHQLSALALCARLLLTAAEDAATNRAGPAIRCRVKLRRGPTERTRPIPRLVA